MNEMLIIILGMTGVTYIPRLLPFILLSVDSLPPKLRLFLRCIPFAALGALIMPGGINGINGKPVLSLVCLAIAAAAAFCTRHLLFSVFISVASAAVLLYLF